MRHSARFFIFICTLAIFLPSAAAMPPKKEEPPPVPAKIMQADSVAIDCDVCPRDLAKAGTTANEELLAWKRFQIVQDRKQADLIFLFSANPYLGDYITRDGPDKRPVMIDGTIMTIIDPHTGQELWSDSRRWGSWRVVGATKDLIAELRTEMESQVKTWTMDDILRCSVTPAYAALAFLTPEDALKRVELGVSRIADAPDRLRISSQDAPEFCREARLVIGPDEKSVGFEVLVLQSDTLELAEVLQRADQFDFVSGKDGESQRPYFDARSKDRKVLIHYDVQGRRSILTRVSYSY